MKLIGAIVADQVYSILKSGRPFDEAAYVKTLQALPTLPPE